VPDDNGAGPYRLSQFEPHVGSVFTALNVDQEGGHAVTLVEATAAESRPDVPRQDPFTLVFVGEVDAHLPQATYVLRHDAMGEVTIFLVPIGPEPDSGRMRYEAVFN